MTNTLIADTGYFAALTNPGNVRYQHAIRVSQTLEYDLITIWPVITEICHYLIKRVSPVAQSLLLKQIANNVIYVIDLDKGRAAKMG